MHDQPGQGPTRQDKTTERMQQERASPGATTAGRPSVETPESQRDTSVRPGSTTPGSPRADDADPAADATARRGDAAAEASTDTPPSPPPAV